jgi:HD-like signal output (HDOD) protein
LPDKYRQIQTLCRSESANELDIESELLGFDHTTIGEMLMKKWKMPPHLKDCVQLHHQVRILDSDNLLVPAVAYGNCLSHAFSIHAEINQIRHPSETDYLIERLRLTGNQVETLQKQVTEMFQSNDAFD